MMEDFSSKSIFWVTKAKTMDTRVAPKAALQEDILDMGWKGPIASRRYGDDNPWHVMAL